MPGPRLAPLFLGKWRDPLNILRGEGRAAVMCARHALRNRSGLGKRHIPSCVTIYRSHSRWPKVVPIASICCSLVERFAHCPCSPVVSFTSARFLQNSIPRTLRVDPARWAAAMGLPPPRGGASLPRPSRPSFARRPAMPTAEMRGLSRGRLHCPRQFQRLGRRPRRRRQLPEPSGVSTAQTPPRSADKAATSCRNIARRSRSRNIARRSRSSCRNIARQGRHKLPEHAAQASSRRSRSRTRP